MLSRSELNKVKSRVAYAVQKNMGYIDFSSIPNTLEVRYLLRDLITLREHYIDIKKMKEVKNDDH